MPVLSESADLELPPIDAEAAAAALQESGLDEDRANEVGHLARLSLIAGRRRTAVEPGRHRPEWARLPVDRLVRRVGANPLLVRLGASLGVVSPVDTWLLVTGRLRPRGHGCLPRRRRDGPDRV